jgi:hypothetical protein
LPRPRLSRDPLPHPKSTFATGEINPEYEDFILEDSVENVAFPHWTAHLRSFWGWYAEEPDYNCAEDDLPRLRKVISEGLCAAGYPDLARDIASAVSAVAIDTIIFSQYTNETNLYLNVNRMLREAHTGANLRGHPLVPWLLQFNSGLRLKPIFSGTSYRGVDMPSSDICQYKLGLMFEWAAFISARPQHSPGLPRKRAVRHYPWWFIQHVWKA